MSLITIAVDAMGGDLAPAAVVAGAIQAVKRRGVAVILTGPADLLREQIEQAGETVEWPLSIATKRSFLCASIPTNVVTCFMTGSYRCGSGAARR